MPTVSKLGYKDRKGPTTLKLLIIFVTLIALYLAVKTFREFASNTIDDRGQASSMGTEGDDSGGDEDISGSPSSFGEQPNEPSPSTNVTNLETSQSAPSSNNISGEVLILTGIDKKEARRVAPPSKLETERQPVDEEIFKALLYYSHWEATSLFALTKRGLSQDEQDSINIQLQTYSNAEYDAPYFQTIITRLSGLSLKLTCDLVSRIIEPGPARDEVIRLFPYELLKYEVGYPGILGCYAERQAKAWAIYLQTTGRSGISQSQRLQAKLKSLPPQSSIERAFEANRILIDALDFAGTHIGMTDPSPDVIMKIKSAMKEEFNASEGVYKKLYVLTKTKTEILRYVTTGENPK